MRLFIIVTLTFTAFAAFSITPFKICLRLSYNSNRTACYEIIKNSNDYFQEELCTICSRLEYDSNKIRCLRLIKNNVYKKDVISLINAADYSSSKLSLLSKYATPIKPTYRLIDNPEIIMNLREALSELKQKKYKHTNRTLESLIEDIYRLIDFQNSKEEK